MPRWIVCLLLAVATLPAAESSAPSATPARSLAALQTQLDAHLAHPRYARSLWGVQVVSLDTGRTLYEHAPDRLLSPASNCKLFVGALALDRLGGDYGIETPLLATAAPDAAGTVAGDVIVSGRGDPSWHSAPARDGFARLCAPWVAALKAAGVRRIAGDLIADATYFRGVPYGAGWTADDLNDYYGAEVSALAIEHNYADLRFTPGDAVGAPARVELVQPHTGLTLVNRTTTVATGGERSVTVRRLIGETTVHVFGTVPLGAAPFVEEATVPRPAGWFARALRAALAEAGIAVDGAVRDVRWPEPSPVPAGAVTLARVASPPLRELVAAFMKPSQNLETNQLFAHLGERTRTAATPADTTSEQLGVAALRAFVQARGLPADEVRFEEGSGLSRNNLASAGAIVALLRAMTAHPEAEAFRASLPIAGEEGTLRRRMQDTPAAGNVRAKTGTLRFANSLSGYVTTAAGERLAFAVMLNRFPVPPDRRTRDDVDPIAVMLAAYAGRE